MQDPSTINSFSTVKLHLRTDKSVDAHLLPSQRKGKVKSREESDMETPKSAKKEKQKVEKEEMLHTLEQEFFCKPW